MGIFEDGDKKVELVQRFEEHVRRELRDFSPPCATPRVFTVPIDEDTRNGELSVFKETTVMLPEEYYQYVLIKVLFTEVFEQASEQDADVLFLPMHLPVYSVCDVDLGASLRTSEVLDSPKPKLSVYSWDTYPRPPFQRANPYCALGQGIVEMNPFYEGCLDWMDETWHLAVTESTIDLHPNDFGLALFPTPFESRMKPGFEKPFLYSFCGVLTYDSMPVSHIRGEGFEAEWERLAENAGEDVYIGQLRRAKGVFGDAVEYRDFTRNSTFTLCPAGWARWSFRIFEAIHDGSIPVILSDYYALPFESRIPWSEFSLRLPEAALPEIDTILRALTPERVAQLQRGLETWREEFSLQGQARNICLEASKRLLSAQHSQSVTAAVQARA